jgi:anti-anti-sigma factor
MRALAAQPRPARRTRALVAEELEVIRCWYPRLCGSQAARFEAESLCPRPNRVVLDLSRVEQIDAFGVLAVARVARRVRATGGLLRVWAPDGPVRSRLAAAGLAEAAEVYQTRDQALAATRVG